MAVQVCCLNHDPKVGRMLSSIPLESTPPESGKVIYQKVSEITGIPDPYKEIKRESTEKALTLYPSLKNEIKKNILQFRIHNK